MWSLKGVQAQPAESLFKLFIPGMRKIKLELNMADTIVLKGSEPVRWLSTDESGFVSTNPGEDFPPELRKVARPPLSSDWIFS